MDESTGLFDIEYVEELKKQVEILIEALQTIIEECCFPEHNQILTIAERGLEKARDEGLLDR